MTWFLIIGAILVLILLIIGVVVSVTSERSLVEKRLGQYIEEEKEKGEKDDSSLLTDWVNKRVEKSSFGDRIARELARADLKFKVAEYYALIVITTVLGSFITGMIGGRHWISFTVGGLVGAALPSYYVRRQKGKRLVRFNDQLSDMLNLVVNGLRAGYSTMQAMDSVSKELPSPICDEFHRVVQEMGLGISMEQALENLYRRIPSDDLDFVITAVNVQREVGGNLAEILDTISFTIRERVRIKGEIRVMTANVMTSGRILSMIPIVLVIFLWFFNREYMLIFFEENVYCGAGALGLAGILIGLGYFVMTRLASIEV